MSESYNVFDPERELRLMFDGPFDLSNLYTKCRSWFEKRQFEFHEFNYKHKKPMASGQEIQIKWLGFRNDSEYVRSEIRIWIHVWDLQTFDAIKDNKKVKMNKGRIRFSFDAFIVTDYRDRWEGSRFSLGLRDFYDKYLLKKKLDLWRTNLELETHKLHTHVKELLDMGSKGEEYQLQPGVVW